jgi:NAD(P)-dependent dehydrogenase (short-subunit alcohol dehydrogenase family)
MERTKMGLESNRVVVVTGASRGAGRGIATELGRSGATVYVTGRTRNEGDAPLPGTVQATAQAVTDAGGTGIAVYCDHADDKQVEQLFEQVCREQGRLDILVNNATYLPDELTQPGPFWEKPLSMTDIWQVGMRSHYVAAWYAAPLLLEAQGGLIVNTSSFGGRIYMHGPAYGAGKAAVDKMSHDMAYDFKPFQVAVVSIWMGLLLTERTRVVFDAEPDKYAELLATVENPEFTGRVIDALANDPKYGWGLNSHRSMA